MGLERHESKEIMTKYSFWLNMGWTIPLMTDICSCHSNSKKHVKNAQRNHVCQAFVHLHTSAMSANGRSLYSALDPSASKYTSTRTAHNPQIWARLISSSKVKWSRPTMMTMMKILRFSELKRAACGEHQCDHLMKATKAGRTEPDADRMVPLICNLRTYFIFDWLNCGLERKWNQSMCSSVKLQHVCVWDSVVCD